ncbi:DUF4259 domain-containing protein [Dactylosporangium sp. NPDC006015]|uniref:DUF4259 domain-containing protein n=1 Tax=Dactylosporangium sp. NPDC006015 TaxID=3154576 RepID=UPI0033B295B8
MSPDGPLRAARGTPHLAASLPARRPRLREVQRAHRSPGHPHREGPGQRRARLRTCVRPCCHCRRSGRLRPAAAPDCARSVAYLDSDFAVEAIAAAAILASQLPGGPTTASLGADFITADGGFDVPTDLPPLALRALDRVVAENSEWRSLWEENSRFEELVGVLAPIRSVLERAGD